MRTTRLLLAACLAVVAAAPAGADDTVEALRDQLAEEYPDFTVDSIEPAPIDGLYEVVSGSEVIYMSGDGRYVFRGNLIDLEAERNLTRATRDRLVAERIDAVDEADMIVFEPEDGEIEHTLTVFTDTRCPYCQDLHNDVVDMVESDGIKVRYLLFPRQGPDSEAADELADVWCADDRQAAMTAAKNERDVPARGDDCDAPVAEHYELGREIGVSGTPYTVVDGGPAFSGYRSREHLREVLAGERTPQR